MSRAVYVRSIGFVSTSLAVECGLLDRIVKARGEIWKLIGTMPGRGTLLNAVMVLLGALLGVVLKEQIRHLNPDPGPAVQYGIGLVTVGLGLKLFLCSKKVLVVAFAIVIGGLVGTLLGLEEAIRHGAQNLQSSLHANSHFSAGLIVTSVLFCVGPLTLLGCLEDAIDRRIDLLGTKSVMDGFSAIVFAAAYGEGVIFTALVVLVVQGLMTAAAVPLRSLARREDVLAELNGAGGIILMAVGAGLLGMKELLAANYLPALVIAPILVILGARLAGRKQDESVAA